MTYSAKETAHCNSEYVKYISILEKNLKEYFINVLSWKVDENGSTKYIAVKLDKELDNRDTIHSFFAKIEKTAWKMDKKKLLFYIY